MAAPNLFEELKALLTQFKQFLDSSIGDIKTAVTAVKAIFPQITVLIDQLIELMGKLKSEIDELDFGAIGDSLTKVSEFTTATKNLLETAKTLLPEEKETIDDVLDVVNVVSALPSLDAVKAEITGLIDAIVVHLNTLKTA